MGNTFKKFKSLLLSIFCFTAVAAADNDYLPLDEIGIGDFEFSEEEVNQIDMMSKEKYSNDIKSSYNKLTGKNFEDLPSSLQTVIVTDLGEGLRQY